MSRGSNAQQVVIENPFYEPIVVQKAEWGGDERAHDEDG